MYTSYPCGRPRQVGAVGSVCINDTGEGGRGHWGRCCCASLPSGRIDSEWPVLVLVRPGRCVLVGEQAWELGSSSVLSVAPNGEADGWVA